MKKVIFKICMAVLPLITMVACSPEDAGDMDINGIPKISDVNVTITVSNDSAIFHIDKKNVAPMWTIKLPDTVVRASYNDFVNVFKLPGTFPVEMRLYNKNGMSDATYTGEVTILHTPTLDHLAGSGSKTWMWDRSVAGHIGCGPAGSNGLTWWSCGANEKIGTGMYDDELTFSTDLTYTFNPGADGLIYVNKDSGYKPAYYGNDGNDYDAPCDEQTFGYSLTPQGADVYLNLDQNAILSYIPNSDALATPSYKILTLNDTLLDMVIQNSWIAWHYRFIPKEVTKK